LDKAIITILIAEKKDALSEKLRFYR